MFKLLQYTFARFSSDNCPQIAAALAYYTLFSMPPLLAIAISIAGYTAKMATFAEHGSARQMLTSEVQTSLGTGAAKQVEEIIDRTSELPSSTLGLLTGVAVLLFGASGVMVQLQSALNLVWKVQPDPHSGGVKNFVMKRVLSFAMVLGVGFVLLVSMLMSAMLHSLAEYLVVLFPTSLFASHPILVSTASNLVIAALLFSTLFKVLPDAQVAWRDAALGGAVTAGLFVVGKLLLANYFAVADIGSSYGAAGSLALILAWVYYSGMIFLLGAELTHGLAVSREGQVAPEPGAVAATSH